MKLLKDINLMPAVSRIQPHINWCLANIPTMIEDDVDRETTERILQELCVKFGILQGKVLQAEITSIDFSKGVLYIDEDGDLINPPTPSVIIDSEDGTDAIPCPSAFYVDPNGHATFIKGKDDEEFAFVFTGDSVWLARQLVWLARQLVDITRNETQDLEAEVDDVEGGVCDLEERQ